jgi:hypothetical protein
MRPCWRGLSLRSRRMRSRRCSTSSEARASSLSPMFQRRPQNTRRNRPPGAYRYEKADSLIKSINCRACCCPTNRINRFSDRHFWHEDYDKASRHHPHSGTDGFADSPVEEAGFKPSASLGIMAAPIRYGCAGNRRFVETAPPSRRDRWSRFPPPPACVAEPIALREPFVKLKTSAIGRSGSCQGAHPRNRRQPPARQTTGRVIVKKSTGL